MIAAALAGTHLLTTFLYAISATDLSDMNKWRALLWVVSLNSFSAVTQAEDILEEVIEQKYVLEPGATLSVRNVDGAIRIYGGSGTELRVQAMKKAFSAQRLKAIDVRVAADSRNVSIDTSFPERKEWGIGDRSGTVEYTLVVPAGIRITNVEMQTGEILVEGLQGGSAKARLANGWLATHDCFCDQDLSLMNGRLDVSFMWWENKDFVVKASSEAGNVRALLPPDASADISAQSQSGHVANSLSGENEVGRSVVTSIGTGAGCRLNLSSQAGNVRLDKSY